jgi:hypothetical protein
MTAPKVKKQLKAEKFVPPTVPDPVARTAIPVPKGVKCPNCRKPLTAKWNQTHVIKWYWCRTKGCLNFNILRNGANYGIMWGI